MHKNIRCRRRLQLTSVPNCLFLIFDGAHVIWVLSFRFFSLWLCIKTTMNNSNGYPWIGIFFLEGLLLITSKSKSSQKLPTTTNPYVFLYYIHVYLLNIYYIYECVVICICYVLVHVFSFVLGQTHINTKTMLCIAERRSFKE